MSKNIISKNDKVEDFSLNDQDGEEFSLSEFDNEKVLLSFHPLSWTSICRKQMLSLEENYENLKELNTTPVGISIDAAPTKKAWAEDMGLKNLRILSDFWPHGEVAEMYGIFREDDGFSERANILVGEDKKVIFSKVYDMTVVPDIGEIIEVLQE